MIKFSKVMVKSFLSIFGGDPSPIKLNGWRCTACNTDRHYVDGVLTLGCAEKRTTEVEGTTYNVACPLAPIDDNGNELTFEQWQKAKRG